MFSKELVLYSAIVECMCSSVCYMPCTMHSGLKKLKELDVAYNFYTKSLSNAVSSEPSLSCTCRMIRAVHER